MALNRFPLLFLLVTGELEPSKMMEVVGRVLHLLVLDKQKQQFLLW
jgi:hypothetical protein